MDESRTRRRAAAHADCEAGLIAEIAIYQDSKGKGTCRSCGAAIEWAETIRGKRIPFDGEIVAVRTQGSPIAVRVIEYVDTAVTPSHFETCPDAKDWRRR